jgi:hypothetical protein
MMHDLGKEEAFRDPQTLPILKNMKEYVIIAASCRGVALGSIQ